MRRPSRRATASYPAPPEEPGDDDGATAEDREEASRELARARAVVAAEERLEDRRQTFARAEHVDPSGPAGHLPVDRDGRSLVVRAGRWRR